MQIYGAKKGSKSNQKPNIQKDTTASTNYINALYGLSEGEVQGLVDGGKSIKLDGTPLINANGQPNFENVSWEFRSGTVDQEAIKGFAAIENERSIGIELRHDRHFTRAISNNQLSALSIRLGWGALREQKQNGDIVGYRIDYAIDLQTDGGAWKNLLTTHINDKASQGYQRSHRIDLPKAKRGWTLRVRRLTPNRDSELIGDSMSVVAITEIIDVPARYPCTALVGVRYDAETFGNIAKISVLMRGMIVQVPSNYNAQTRTYTGIWDGTFIPAYTNNPAWVFYDICTAKRYGLGDRLAGKVDKWSLYRLAQYCDEMVDDGQGGKEPRFTCNVYLQQADDAYKVLQSLSSIFRAMSYWDGTQIIVDADVPKDTVYTFSNANVVGGSFVYTGARKRDRHTICKVAFDDPDNEFKTDYVHVRNEYAIAKYGISVLEINAFGCTSRSQAYRAGAWALQSEQLETETVSFSAGLDGFVPSVGEVIDVLDNTRAGRGAAGRIISAHNRVITLDRTAGKVGDTLVINSKEGNAQTAKITKVAGVELTLDKTLDADVGAIWAVTSHDLAPRKFRVMSITQNEDQTFAITGLQYEPSKFSAADNGVQAIQMPVSVIKPGILDAPSNVIITSHNREHQGQSITTLSINWAQVKGAVAYIVEWRKDDNAWQVSKIASQSLDIDGVYSGNYQARVKAVDAFDNESDYGVSTLTQITGKIGKPPRLASFTAKGILFGMELGWIFNAGSGDTNYTEIQVSPDGRSNIATLGQFAYPTNSHTITGLQGNLRQFYRARIVDKLGNVSDWTAWASGTTSADAGKVLELLSGQITESQLDRSLREPIEKIKTLDARIDRLNDLNISKLDDLVIDINAINQSIAETSKLLESSRTELQSAVNDISTQKNRISSAIVDINTLKQSNDAKTQELLNLTQTVGGHTSSIRDLNVTTGQISQSLREIKTTTDTASSKIRTIEQTQANQAIKQTALESKADNTQSSLDEFKRTEANANSALSSRINSLDAAYKQADRQINASLSTLEESITSKDQAMSRRVDNIDAAYKQADIAANARIAREEQARSSADEALSQRITQLDAAYKSADVEMRGRITNVEKVASDATQAIAQTHQQLSAKFDSLEFGGRNLLLESKEREIYGSGNWSYEEYRLSEPLQSGQTYTFRASVQVLSSWANEISVQFDGSIRAYTIENGKIAFTAAANNNGSQYIRIYAGRYGSTSGRRVRITNAKLEKGSIPSDWTPAPEDTGDVGKVIDAKIDEYRQAQARQDRAMAEQVRTLQTSVNDQTTSVRNIERSVDGISAIKAVTVDNNGFISGYGIMSELVNGRVISRFGINADQIYFGNSMSDKKPFIVNTRGQWQGGVYYPAGTWIDSAYIANSSITNAHIANAAISTAKIENGAISTAKIGVAQVDTLQIAGEAVIVPRAQSFQQVKSNYQGELFSLTIETMRSAVLINVQVDVSANALETAFSREDMVTATAIIDMVFKIKISCNNAIIREQLYSVYNTRSETRYRNGWEQGGLTQVAQVNIHGQTLGVYNFVHVSPPSNARYQVSIERIGNNSTGSNGFQLNNGSVLVMAIKR